MDVIFEFEDVEFVWDEAKYASNLRKHSVRFEEAAEVFFDPFYRYGDATDAEEAREYIIGYSFKQKLLLVVFVERDVTIRIISARPATPNERKVYEQE